MREMKDSGIEWIAHIPSSWTTDRMKYLFANGKGLSITKENLVETGLPVISYGQIHSKSNSGTDIKDELLRFVDFQYQTNYPQCEVFQYDFVFADTSEDYDGCGNCVYKRDSSLLFGGYHAIILHSLVKRDNRYFAYLFKTDSWRKQLREVASGVKLFSITQKVLMNSSVIIPPEDEQKAISDYLDSRCTELDTIISDIQSQIEALEEYKRSVITEAVTKGLDPDVEMRDSGVQWIGMIPKHWRITKFKYICKVKSNLVDVRKYQEYPQISPERNERSVLGEEEPLSMSQKFGIIPTSQMDIIPNMASSFVGAKITHIDDLVFNKLKAHLGVFAVSKYYGLVSPDYAVYFTSGKSIVKYLEFLFKTENCISEFKRRSTGVGAGLTRLYTSDLFDIKVPIPPISEQMEIAKHLDCKISEINLAISEKQQQIETIEEYKKSLIFEYVTGKKEVQA